MQIGIDTTLAAHTRIVGISRFVVSLVTQLAEIDSNHTFYLCYRLRALRHPRLVWRPQHPRFRVRFIQEPFNQRLFRRLDVYHATDNRLPGYRNLVPFLGTLHDVFYLSQPEMGSARTRSRWQARYRDVAARAQLIMTTSEFSKAEIVCHLGVPPQRVRVVPLAPSAGYVPQHPAAVAAVRQRYGLTAPYILFGGGFGRRKNPLGALRAFHAALPRLPADVRFALSGIGGPFRAEVETFIRQAGLGDRVTLVGFIPDADHPALISGCMLYFFPSLLEGFGLPAVEAMACGAPLVTAATTSLPEVCADAAVMVDPTDEAALADALVEVAGNQTLRETLVVRGLQRAGEFTWRRVAEQVLRLYEELA